jgi:hypothetical protein
MGALDTQGVWARQDSQRVQAGQPTVVPAGTEVVMADTFRVVVDVQKIRANLWTHEQARLSEAEIRYWLQSVGFRPDSETPAQETDPGEAEDVFIADSDALRRLDQSEVISVRPV